MSRCYATTHVKTGKIIYHEVLCEDKTYDMWTSCSECGSTNLSFADEECPDCGAIIIGEKRVKE